MSSWLTPISRPQYTTGQMGFEQIFWYYTCFEFWINCFFKCIKRKSPFLFDVYFHDDSWSHISHCVCACSFQAKSQVRSKQPNCAACVKWCLLTVSCKGPWTPHVCDCSVQGCNRRDNNGVTKKTLRLSSKLRWSQFDLRQKTEWFFFFLFTGQVRLLLHQTETEYVAWVALYHKVMNI